MTRKISIAAMVLLLAVSCTMNFDYGKKPLDFYVIGDSVKMVGADWLREPTSPEGSVFRYTTDGTEPTPDSDILSGKVKIEDGVTVKVKAFQSLPYQKVSETCTLVTDSTRVTETPSVRTEKTESGSIKVTINRADENDTVFYGTGGTDTLVWSPDREIYDGAVELPHGEKLALSAMREGMFSPEIITYAIEENEAPVIGWRYEGDKIFAVLTHLPGALIRYTTDGTEPDEASAVYGGEIPMPLGGKVKAKAWFLDEVSGVAEAVAEYDAVPVPEVKLESDCIEGWKVTLVSNAPSTVVRWTKDGSEPTKESLSFTGTVGVDGGSTLKFASFSSATDKKSETLEIVVPAGPIISFVESGSCQEVFISAVGWDEIYYTTDGSDPQWSKTSTRYKESFEVDAGTAINAVAWHDGTYSEISSATAVPESEVRSL